VFLYLRFGQDCKQRSDGLRKKFHVAFVIEGGDSDSRAAKVLPDPERLNIGTRTIMAVGLTCRVYVFLGDLKRDIEFGVEVVESFSRNCFAGSEQSCGKCTVWNYGLKASQLLDAIGIQEESNDRPRVFANELIYVKSKLWRDCEEMALAKRWARY
jgi:hypothetical protein